MDRARLALLFVLVAVPASAQIGPDRALNGLQWEQHQTIADWSSTALVGAALVAPCWNDRHRDCFIREGVNVGLTVGLAELTKRLVKRERPNGHDNLSFFSEHTALACVGSVRSKAWALCPAVGYLRIAAGFHWGTDVMAGAAVGAAVAWRR